MLKYVFPISICKELPELKVLIIREADELEEIFVCEVDEKVNIPNLKFVAFVNLPSLSQTQGIHFQAAPYRFIQSCRELSLTSAITKDVSSYTLFNDYWEEDFDLYEDIKNVAAELLENPRIEVHAASGHMFTSSQELTNQQHLQGEIDASIKPFHGNNNLEGSPSERLVAESLSTIQVIDSKQKGIIEETALTNTKTTSKEITTSQDQRTQEGSTSGTKNDQDIQLPAPKQKSIQSSFEDVDLGDSHETTQTNNNQVSLNDDASKSEPSSSTTSPIASQIPSMPSKDFDLYFHVESLYRKFQEDSKGHDNGNENPNARTTKDFAAWVEAKAASWHALTSSKLEGSTSENTEAAKFSTISETKNEPPIQLDVAPKQKGNKICFQERTTSTDDKSITSSTHLLPATKYVDIGDSHETIDDIDKLIKEDSLLAFEMFLTGVPSFSIRTLLQELKTLLDSSSDLDHLVSNKESKSKLISLLHGLNQHQGLLPSDVKEFVEKVKTFFIDIINKHASHQQLLKKHKQLLDLKPGLLKKLLSAKSKQFHIVSETSTANAQIHKRSLETDELRKQLEDLENQIDDLKSVVNRCNVQKEELNAECSEWAQKSKEFASALASNDVDLREAERARNLATEGFSNLKSSFPTY
ncbi:hypothetical protein MtrunA17_Chr3g0107201 [Medicago truncatula]|nr:hypothetical protein MtrunA17_Chr3g0107201 [Medicago truncatula]